MVTATLRSVGGSVMIAIPKAMLEGLGLAANAKVGLRVDRGRLVVEPRPRPKYSLAQLLAECDLDAPMSEEEREWDRLPEAGREAL